MKIFTWHIHGTYLYYLSQCNATFYIPVRPQQDEGYYGRGETFPFGANVVEIAVSEIGAATFDLILFQTNKNYLEDQYEILTAEQRSLPRVYIEHDPPRQHPVNTRHIVQDPDVLLVHVTAFNALMWDNGRAAVTVIDHGVKVRAVPYLGVIPKGIVMVNNFASRGRLLGLDLFYKVREQIPLDLIGMNSEEAGGLGEVLHPDLPEFLSAYRFFFNPIRYTSLGLSVCEAMTLGLPVAGLATTEMVTVIKNGVNGFLETSIDKLISSMKRLLDDADLARRLGESGKAEALKRFSINRFVSDWELVFKRQLNHAAPYSE